MRFTPIGVGIAVGILLFGAGLANHQNQSTRADKTAEQEYGISLQSTLRAEASYRDEKAYRDEWRAKKDLEAQREMARTSWWMMFATFVGILLLAGTLYETSSAAIAAASAAEQSRRATDIAQQALDLSERPWVKVDACVDAPIEFINGALMLQLKITLKNVGKSPTLGAMAYARIAPGNYPIANFKADFAKDREERRTHIGLGRVIFPNSEFPETYGLGMSKRTIEGALALNQPSDPPFLFPVVYGIALYHGPNTRLYETRFVFHLRRQPNNHGNGIEITTAVIPTNELELLRSVLGELAV